MIEEQLEQRVNLINYYNKEKFKAILKGEDYHAFDVMINVALKQISALVEKQIALFFVEDTKNLPNKYKTAEDVKKESAIERLNNLVKEQGMLSVETTQTEDKFIVIDLIYLPSQYKEMTLQEMRENLENHYGCKVVLIDSSTVNTHVNSIHRQPVYLLK